MITFEFTILSKELNNLIATFCYSINPKTPQKKQRDLPKPVGASKAAFVFDFNDFNKYFRYSSYSGYGTNGNRRGTLSIKIFV